MEATLDALPNELIEGILDFVDDNRTLKDISLTNWHLHNLTASRIYSTFSGQSPALFLRAVTMRDAYVEYVKDVIWTLELPTHFDPSSTAAERSLSFAERHRITEAFRSLGVAAPHSILDEDIGTLFDRGEHSNFNDDHWFLEFFLLFLPNVESLLVHDAWLWKDHVYWFKNIAVNAHRFHRLKSVTIRGPLRIENVVPLLFLPTLRNLELWQVLVMRQESGEQFEWDQPGRTLSRMLPNVSSNLEKLVLREAFLPTTTLILFLNSIRSLKIFTYQHADNDLVHAPGWDKRVDYDVLAVALSRHALETLRINDHRHIKILTMPVHIFSSLGSLQSLETELLISSNSEEEVRALKDYLPAGLRRFEVELSLGTGDPEDGEWKAEFVRRFARVMQGTQLKELLIKWRERAVGSSVQQALAQELEGMGITLLAQPPKYVPRTDYDLGRTVMHLQMVSKDYREFVEWSIRET